MENKTKHGGPRPGSGRPRLNPTGESSDHTAYLPDGMAVKIAAIADGNFSAGVRALWEFYSLLAALEDQDPSETEENNVQA